MPGNLTSSQGHSEPLSEINVTPLVDVMLVLLVIFILTAPLLVQAIVADRFFGAIFPRATNGQRIEMSLLMCLCLDRPSGVGQDAPVFQTSW